MAALRVHFFLFKKILIFCIFFKKTLDINFASGYNYYAVKYGLMPEVTLVTGNQRELGRTSSRQRLRADHHCHIFYCLTA